MIAYSIDVQEELSKLNDEEVSRFHNMVRSLMRKKLVLPIKAWKLTYINMCLHLVVVCLGKKITISVALRFGIIFLRVFIFQRLFPPFDH